MSKRLWSNAPLFPAATAWQGPDVPTRGTGPCRRPCFPTHRQPIKGNRVFLFSPKSGSSRKHQTPTTKTWGREVGGAYPLPKNTLPKTFFSSWKIFSLPNENISVTNNSSEKSLAAKGRKLKENPCSISTHSPMWPLTLACFPLGFMLLQGIFLAS